MQIENENMIEGEFKPSIFFLKQGTSQDMGDMRGSGPGAVNTAHRSERRHWKSWDHGKQYRSSDGSCPALRQKKPSGFGTLGGMGGPVLIGF